MSKISSITFQLLNVEVKAVFSQYCETSTTVLHPIHELEMPSINLIVIFIL